MIIDRLYDVYPSTILEGFKKNRNYQKEDMVRQDFFRYLKQQYPDFDKTEFTKAKTKEEAKAVADKYQDDFKRFVKKQPKRFIPLAVQFGIVAADIVGVVPENVASKLYKIILVDDLIYYVKEFKKERGLK